MKRRGGAGAAVAILAVIGIYSAFPHPVRDQSTLKAIAVESRQLIAIYQTGSGGRSFDVPIGKWPPAIASPKPYSVIVRPGMLDITTKPFSDGGWGYGFITDKRNLTMLEECWSYQGYDIYWHGPC